MTRLNNSAALRVGLFIFGLCVVVLALVALPTRASADSAVLLFTTIDAVMLYVILFAPLLVVERVQELSEGRIVSMGIVWRATIPYALLSLGVMYGANSMPHPPLALLCVVQLAGLFGLALALFFGGAAENHIGDVERHEVMVRSSVSRLRGKSEELVAVATHAGLSQADDTQELAVLTGRIADELRYMTSVPTDEAMGLERHIAANLERLQACIHSDMGRAEVTDAKRLAEDTLVTIAQRRAMHN